MRAFARSQKVSSIPSPRLHPSTRSISQINRSPVSYKLRTGRPQRIRSAPTGIHGAVHSAPTRAPAWHPPTHSIPPSSHSSTFGLLFLRPVLPPPPFLARYRTPSFSLFLSLSSFSPSISHTHSHSKSKLTHAHILARAPIFPPLTGFPRPYLVHRTPPPKSSSPEPSSSP